MATRINVTTVTSAYKPTHITDYTAATVSEVNTPEEFEASISAPDGKFFIVVDNVNGESNVNLTLNNSDYGTSTKLLGYTFAGKKSVVFAESLRCKSGENIRFTLAPTSNKSLSGTKVGVIQFLPVVNN